jgi:large subunit ribosomal protein L21e
MKTSHGPRSDTRHRLQKKPRDRGLTKITKALQTFEEGERAIIRIDPSVHRGMPSKRFHGVMGTVQSRRGDAYVLAVHDGNKPKTVIARPEHLMRVE